MLPSYDPVTQRWYPIAAGSGGLYIFDPYVEHNGLTKIQQMTPTGTNFVPVEEFREKYPTPKSSWLFWAVLIGAVIIILK